MSVKTSIEQLRGKESNLALASQIGIELDSYNTDELYEYVRDCLNCKTYLRNWLEEQIIAAEINYRKYNVTHLSGGLPGQM